MIGVVKTSIFNQKSYWAFQEIKQTTKYTDTEKCLVLDFLIGTCTNNICPEIKLLDSNNWIDMLDPLTDMLLSVPLLKPCNVTM